jgi:molybdopterin/thiamine biosynthesis adenylyltransferase
VPVLVRRKSFSILPGKIGFVDFDTVEIGNMHRQIIHKESFVGKYKAESARDTILAYFSTFTNNQLQFIN